MNLDDTIAAIATPLGSGGVGIIKLSGPDSLSILNSIFQASSGQIKFKPRYLHYGQIVNPRTETLLDEVLVAYMPQPHSYTKQDVVEIQGGGGDSQNVIKDG